MFKLRDELNKPIVRFGLPAVVMIFLILEVILPWVKWRHEISDSLSFQSKIVIPQENLEFLLSELNEKNNLLETKLTHLESFFQLGSKSPDEAYLPTYVREVASANGLKVSKISVSDQSIDSKTLSYFVVRLNASGSVDKMMSFIQYMEKHNQFFIIGKLKISRLPSSNAQMYVELKKYVL